MTESTTKFFSFENNPFLGTARKASKTGCDIIEGMAREQIAGETKFVDLSSKQFYAFVDAKNIEDMIKANREWFGESFKIVTEHSGNAFKLVQDNVSKLISRDENPVNEMMGKAEDTIAKTTKFVEEAAA